MLNAALDKQLQRTLCATVLSRPKALHYGKLRLPAPENATPEGPQLEPEWPKIELKGREQE